MWIILIVVILVIIAIIVSKYSIDHRYIFTQRIEQFYFSEHAHRRMYFCQCFFFQSIIFHSIEAIIPKCGGSFFSLEFFCMQLLGTGFTLVEVLDIYFLVHFIWMFQSRGGRLYTTICQVCLLMSNYSSFFSLGCG